MQKLVCLLLLSLVASACSDSKNSDPGKSRPNPQVVLENFDKSIEKNWALTKRYTENTTDAEGFANLVARFPRPELLKFDPRTVTTAEIDVSFYAFIGPTTCPKDDPRLAYSTFYYDVCGGTPQILMCEVPALAVPSDRDPCLTPN